MQHLAIGICCLATVTIEVLFFALFGYRNRRFVIAAIIANVTSNLALNYTILLTGVKGLSVYPWVLLGLEIGAWVYESIIYLIVEKEKGNRVEIVLLTLAANCASFLVGIPLSFFIQLLNIPI